MEQHLEQSVVQHQLSNRHPLNENSLLIALRWKLAALSGRPEFDLAVKEAVSVCRPFCDTSGEPFDGLSLDQFGAHATVADFARKLPANRLEACIVASAEQSIKEAQRDPAVADYIALARAIQDGPGLLARMAIQRGARKQAEKQALQATKGVLHPPHPTLQ